MSKDMNNWVVVVDDDILTLSSARNLLKSQHMRVSCLQSGRDLLKFMQKNEPDLILLDVMMPDLNGFDTLLSLRQFEESSGRKPTPIIFLSGDIDNETESKGLNIGASDFVRKPFDKSILISRINNAIANNKMIESLTAEAMVDKLTGFYNKSNGTEKISELCNTRTGALMIFDIDNFKLVNDLYGHNMGDRILQSFAEIIRNNIRVDDVISRIGGDEFLGFFCDITEEPSVAALTKRLNEQLLDESVKLMGEDFDIPIGISVGAAMAPEHAVDYGVLFQYADSSLYNVKKNGKHGYEIYSPSNNTEDNEEDLDKEILRLTQIVEERGGGQEALLLGQDSFSWNYRFVMRFIKRYHGSAESLLFSISSKDPSVDVASVASEFADILQKTLRKSDIIMQSRPNQFFLLLPEMKEGDVPGVINRIMRLWNETKYHEMATIQFTGMNTSYRDEDA